VHAGATLDVQEREDANGSAARSSVIDIMFFFCSQRDMTRIDEDALSIRLEVALAGATPSLLDDLTNPDRYRRNVAVTTVARHLAERLRCFDIRSEEAEGYAHAHPSLFPQDLGPIGDLSR
jgi:hypothetical protein